MDDSIDNTNDLENYGVWVKHSAKDENDLTDSLDSLDLPDFPDTDTFDDTDFSDMFKDDSQFTSEKKLDDFDTQEIETPEIEIPTDISEQSLEASDFADFTDNFETNDNEVSVDSFATEQPAETEAVSFDSFEEVSFDSDGEEEISLDDFMDGGFSDVSVAAGNNGFEPGKNPAEMNNQGAEEVSLDDFFGEDGFDLGMETAPKKEEEIFMEEKPLEMEIDFDDSVDSVETEDNTEVDTDVLDDMDDEYEISQSLSEDLEEPVITDSSVNKAQFGDTEDIDLSDFGIDADAEETPVTQDVEEAKNKEKVIDYDLSVGNENMTSAPVVNEIKTDNNDVMNTSEILELDEGNDNMATVDSSLLQQIIDDLSGLRNEINQLKSNLAAIKANDSAQLVENQNMNIDSPSEEENTGFFSSDDGDDTIALSGNELDNILNTAEFSETDGETQQEENFSEQSAFDEINIEESIIEEPTSDEINIEETIVEEPTSDEINIEESIIEEPTSDEINIEEPIVEETVSEEINIEESFVEEPAFDEINIEEPFVEETSSDEIDIEESIIEETSSDEIDIEEPIVEEPISDEIDIEESFVEEPTSDEINIEESFVEEPVSEEINIEEDKTITEDSFDDSLNLSEADFADSFEESTEETDLPDEISIPKEEDDGIITVDDVISEPITDGFMEETAVDESEVFDDFNIEDTINTIDEEKVEDGDSFDIFEEDLKDDFGTIGIESETEDDFTVEQEVEDSFDSVDSFGDLDDFGTIGTEPEENEIEENIQNESTEDEITSENVIEESIADEIIEDEITEDSFDIPETFAEEPAVQEDSINFEAQFVDSSDDQLSVQNTQTQKAEINSDLKSDIKSVLLYMDQLLENLPEEKIMEFAHSDEFATYKKLFNELGLS